jgi:hypothetical protein
MKRRCAMSKREIASENSRKIVPGKGKAPFAAVLIFSIHIHHHDGREKARDRCEAHITTVCRLGH